jgi:hypothetical protein
LQVAGVVFFDQLHITDSIFHMVGLSFLYSNEPKLEKLIGAEGARLLREMLDR